MTISVLLIMDCYLNILISTCKCLSDSCKHFYVDKLLPRSYACFLLYTAALDFKVHYSIQLLSIKIPPLYYNSHLPFFYL